MLISSCRSRLLLVGASLAAMTVASSAMAQAPEEKSAEGSALEEVVVTGSRLQVTGFSTPTPVTVVGAEQFERRAANAVIDVLQEIPSFRPAAGSTQVTGGTFSTGQSILDLRALGGTRTLVLVDGIRPVPTNADGTYDSNQIPASLVTRTEIVTGGASAAYGSDAVAGVVNFILNDRLEGLKGSMQYGISQEGDAAGVTFSAAWGTKFAGDRGHFIIGGDYSKTDPSGTMYDRDWGRDELGWVPVLAPRGPGVPAFVLAPNAHMKRGQSALITGCRIGGVLRTGAACPLNLTTFDANGNPTPFVLGSLVGSTIMAGGSNEGFGPGHMNYLRTGADRYAALAKATYELTDTITAFAQFQAGSFEVESRTQGPFLTRPVWTGPVPLLINADNPFIPAATRAIMTAQGITQLAISDTELLPTGTVIRNHNTSWQGIAGVRGEFNDNWRWDFTFSQGHGNFKYIPQGWTLYPNFYAAVNVVSGPNGPMCGPTATNPNWASLSAAQQAALQPGCVPFNIFTTNRSEAAQSYISPELIQTTLWDRRTAQANISGTVLEGWAGPITAAFGAEWRDDELEQKLNGNNSQLNASGAFFGPQPTDGKGDVSVYEYYGEAGLPVLKDAGLAGNLDLNAAFRRTHYSTSGWVTTWKVGGNWEPMDALRFRATRSRDIRAPSLVNLFIRGPFGAGTFVNPVNGVTFNALSASGNNPDLVPERADTTTAGVVFQPKWDAIGRFRVSVDWYKITIDDVIAGIAGQQLINLYYGVGSPPNPEYSQFLTFDTSCTPAAGNTCGGITIVRSPPLNLNLQRTVGWDIEIAYTAPLEEMGLPGRLQVTNLASYLQDLYQIVPGANGTTVRQANTAGSIPRWRGTTNFNYTLDKLGLNIGARWFTKVKLNANGVGPEDPGYNPALPNSMSTNRFPAEVYWSLGATYNVIDEEDRKLQAFLVVDNLLDNDPPRGTVGTFQALFATPPTTVGYQPYDAVGRYFKMGVRFQY